MFTHHTTVSFQGIEAIEVKVETHITGGSLPSFSIVGLPDKAVSESKERIRSALFNLGLALPPKRVLINLSPANIQKEGSHYDLPIFIGLMRSMDILPEKINDYISLGEMGLDGSLKPVLGILSASFYAASCQKSLICPKDCGGEAVWGGNLSVLAPGHILELINHFKKTQILSSPKGKIEEIPDFYPDFCEIKGQNHAKRALMIAAAGRHNLLMMGPPGSGKSMLASRMIGILPSLEPRQALEVTMIHSRVEGRNHKPAYQLFRIPPFRNPHHSASMAALVGGGGRALPGEVSLAHEGILFLDELPEFSSSARESMRQSLESKEITIARANHHVRYPANFQLIAAMNPCRCGYFGDAQKQCHKAPTCAKVYQSRLSGPFLDRIDLFVEVPAIKVGDLASATMPPQNPEMKNCVLKARSLQRIRYQKRSFQCNSEADSSVLDQELSSSVKNILIRASEKWGFSVRSYYRIIRVARTIADLNKEKAVTEKEIKEALSYRFWNMFR